MNIYLLSAFRDNYLFLLHFPQEKMAVVVDPGDPVPVLRKLQELDAELVAILNTHHHWDHVDGNLALQSAFPEVVIYGSQVDRGRIPGQTVFLQDGDRISVGSRQIEVLLVPGHTQGHLAYYFPPQVESTIAQPGAEDGSGDLFCGDTIFSAGCGRLKEGTPEQMWTSLARLRSLPESTRIWCAHEYTLSNLQFALRVDPNNIALQARYQTVQHLRAQQQPTIPTWIELEKRTNPFLRCDQPSIQQQVNQLDPVNTLAALRQWKEQVTG
ncbi:MAG: hydroxyacylglutathione hydrolase [Synechococcales bacterium]|nr:hydroxyacylglutathione hydrolase [Synechococcales bacterium]